MNQTPEQLALQYCMTICQGHADALQDALQDMQRRAIGADDYASLSKEDRRLPDQFAYRYTRLQAAIQAATQLLAVLERFKSKNSL